MLAHAVQAGDHCSRELCNQFLRRIFRGTEGVSSQMTVKSGIRTRGVSAFVKRVRGEGLAVDELLALRVDDMVVVGGVIGLVTFG